MFLPSFSERSDVVCDWNDICYYDTAWYNYGRWLVVAAIALTFIIIIFLMRRNARRRVLLGRAPMTGTGWMVPPSYFQSQRDYNDSQGPPAAPPYNPTLGHEDAGYYDLNGNFIRHDVQLDTSGPPSGPPPTDNSTLQHPDPAVTHQQQFGYELGHIYPTDRKSSGYLSSPEPVYTGAGTSSSNTNSNQSQNPTHTSTSFSHDNFYPPQGSPPDNFSAPHGPPPSQSPN